jgi:hypothetical protein
LWETLVSTPNGCYILWFAKRTIVPGEEISAAIKKLGKLGLFDEISFYVNKSQMIVST